MITDFFYSGSGTRVFSRKAQDRLMLSLVHSSSFIPARLVSESGYSMSKRATDEWEMRAKEKHKKEKPEKQLQAIDESGARVWQQVQCVSFKRGAEIADEKKKETEYFFVWLSNEYIKYVIQD